jgi:hypothetical protein
VPEELLFAARRESCVPGIGSPDADSGSSAPLACEELRHLPFPFGAVLAPDHDADGHRKSFDVLRGWMRSSYAP